METEQKGAAATEPDPGADEPVLPWHYLGTGVCLTGNPDPLVPEPNALIEKLLNLDGKDLLRALAHDQAGDAEDGLMAYVLEIGRSRAKPGRYSWDRPWPKRIPVHLRAGMPPGSVFLTPGGLFVSVDFPADSSRKVLEKYEGAQGPDRKPHPQARLPVDRGLWLSEFMHAGDDAVASKDPAVRADFASNSATPAVAKAWIVNRARTEYGYSGPDYPDSVSVTVEPDRRTTETAWRVRGGRLDFALGTKDHSDKAILYDHWPCGAIAGDP